MKLISIFIFVFIMLVNVNFASNFYLLTGYDGSENRTYCDNVQPSGFYNPQTGILHGSKAFRDCLAQPQVPTLKNYRGAIAHQIYFASRRENIPNALRDFLLGRIDLDESPVEFYVNIQCGVALSTSFGLYHQDIKGVNNIWPHYALFDDATPHNKSLVDGTYDRTIKFEEALILPMMPSDLTLKEAGGPIIAHPPHPSGREMFPTALSPNNYILDGDRRIPWLFFSYFRTTQGKQILTLHYVVDDEGITRLAPYFVDSKFQPLDSTEAVFRTLMRELNNHPYMEAVAEILLNGNLTDFARAELEKSIAAKEHTDRAKQEERKTFPPSKRFELLDIERLRFERRSGAYRERHAETSYVPETQAYLDWKIAEIKNQIDQLAPERCQELKALLPQYIEEARQYSINNPSDLERLGFLNWRVHDTRYTIETLKLQAINVLGQRLQQFKDEATTHERMKPAENDPQYAAWATRSEYLSWMQGHTQHTLQQLEHH